MPDHIPLTDKSVPAGDFSSWLAGTDATQLQGAEADVPCGDCNGCCKSFYFIHVTPEDTGALAAIPQELLFEAPGAPPGHFVMGYNEYGHCPMLVDDRCSIYDVRPQTCRAYDCRIFTACDMQPGETDKALVSARTARWQFSFASRADQDVQSAIAQAAHWLRREQQNPESSLPENFLPSNSTQLAVLALQIHPLFVQPDTAEKRSDAEFTKAVMTLARQRR